MTTLLLTASVVLGVVELRAWRPGGVPRFAVASMHRTLSLLALALLAVHVVTSLADSPPHIAAVNALLPFATSYRTIWMGLGTVASNLMVAVVVTSLVRGRLGYRAWRAVHWLAYACWPLAVVHGLGTGSDTKAGWMLALTFVCAGAVVVALAIRAARGAASPRTSAGLVAVVAAGAIGLAVWLAQGPLSPGWARRAGTPRSVVAAFAPRRRAVPSRDPFAKPFASGLSGQIRSGSSSDGSAVVELRLGLSGPPEGRLSIRLGGQSLPDGGLQLSSSAVSFRVPGVQGDYRGRVAALSGTRLRALVGSPGGRALRLSLDLQLAGDAVTGQVRGRPAGIGRT